jgi:hypothetical protein
VSAPLAAPNPAPIKFIRALAERHLEGSHGTRRLSIDLIKRGPPPGTVLARVQWWHWIEEARSWKAKRAVMVSPGDLRTLALVLLRAADELAVAERAGVVR